MWHWREDLGCGEWRAEGVNDVADAQTAVALYLEWLGSGEAVRVFGEIRVGSIVVFDDPADRDSGGGFAPGEYGFVFKRDRDPSWGDVIGVVFAGGGVAFWTLGDWAVDQGRLVWQSHLHYEFRSLRGLGQDFRLGIFDTSLRQAIVIDAINLRRRGGASCGAS